MLFVYELFDVICVWGWINLLFECNMFKIMYYVLYGGYLLQMDLLIDCVMFIEVYVVIFKGVMCDIVMSWLLFWIYMCLWVIVCLLLGFVEIFLQYIVEVNLGGGSDKFEQDKNVEVVLFVVEGEVELMLQGKKYMFMLGGYVFILLGVDWMLYNVSDVVVCFYWICKYYQVVDGIFLLEVFVINEQDVELILMLGINGVWVMMCFVDMSDMCYDMYVNIVMFELGGVILFVEIYVMEYGLYVFEGKVVYCFNQDWVEVEVGDFMWLCVFCLQVCYLGGFGCFCYLLYKDVNCYMNLILNLLC